MLRPSPIAVSSRRTFLAAATAAPVALASLSVAGPHCGPSSAPAGGFFSGSERIRVGLIGAGGRGTGAALQAAVADRAVEIVAIGDLFADRIASSVSLLRREIGPQFACPAEQRWIGPDAYRHVLATGVDVVLLAAPPHTRSQHLAAAVAAGCHVYCETPAAIDIAGTHAVAATLAEAERNGLVVVSGLCQRRDEPTVELMGRIHAGAVGNVRHLSLVADLGLPWQIPAQAGWAAEEWRQRNWISHPEYSGGQFVEQHIHALDRALWALGDAVPLMAVGRATSPLGSAGSTGTEETCVEYTFAGGATLLASCRRSDASRHHNSEMLVGSRGSVDLRRHLIQINGIQINGQAGWQPSRAPAGGQMYQAALDALLRGVRSGRQAIDGPRLVQSTLAAIMGRMAAEGRPVAWTEVCPQTPRSTQTV